ALPSVSRRHAVKRLFDVCVALLLSIGTAPLAAAIALALFVRSSGQPVIARQRRVGASGKEFELLQFRARPSTRLGKFLSRWGLDKLPQLLNVLRGDMSLVGPSPMPPEMAAELLGRFPAYLDRRRMKSGITGWAQVKGVESAQSAEYDLYYMEHWTLGFDIRVLLLAIGKVLRGKSASSGVDRHEFLPSG
ncbi:MAG: sugar transferase, partial [bacterium]